MPIDQKKIPPSKSSCWSTHSLPHHYTTMRTRDTPRLELLLALSGSSNQHSIKKGQLTQASWRLLWVLRGFLLKCRYMQEVGPYQGADWSIYETQLPASVGRVGGWNGVRAIVYSDDDDSYAGDLTRYYYGIENRENYVKQIFYGR
jgi:hypothetical protein